MAKIELKDCPFCGGTAAYKGFVPRDKKQLPRRYAECSRCHARTTGVAVAAGVTVGEADELAADFWNMREEPNATD